MQAEGRELRLDLVGVQDHPYAWFLDTFTLVADLLARTRTIRVFHDVANLPLRGAAMIAKAAASMDVISGGRFEPGLGAGGMWRRSRPWAGLASPVRPSTRSSRRWR